MQINQITHRYSKEFSLNIKDITLSNNKVIGLVGENGAGKTTLMDILSSMIIPNSTFDVNDYRVDSILYIPSDITPYEFLTVKEFCDLVLKYSSSRQSSKDLMKDLGLFEKENTLISQLSQGMKKKLTLINIYINTYSLVILDEPFNSIDLKYTYQIKKIIRQLSKKSTILISSHIVDTLIDICDEFILIDNGSVKKQFINTGDKRNLEEELFDAPTTDRN